MSDLRETVAAAISRARYDGEYMDDWGQLRSRETSSSTIADAAIAAVAQALLSDEAVEAAAKAVAALDWDTGEMAFQPTARDVARVPITAALAAIGYSAEAGEG